MGVRFLGRPIVLEIEIERATERFDSALGRYFVEAAVAAPREKRGRKLALVVDGVDADWTEFVRPKSRWLIDCDELVLDEQAAYGLSFWAIEEMHPRRPETPNQSLQHNAGSRPSSGGAPGSETPTSPGPRG
jgi:hypothetical protein